MKKRSYVTWILLAEAVGALSGLLSREGIERYTAVVDKPALTPPAIVFPIAWAILYALMGVSGARVWEKRDAAAGKWGMNLWFAQFVVNFFWSLIFFNAQAYGFALVWLLLLWGLALGMILLFRRVDPRAAIVQIPYLLWLTFAAWLNYGVWQLNM